MPDRSFPRAGARTVVLVGITLFVAVLALLAVQMASGNDPALGTRNPAKAAKRVAASPQPVQPQQPASTDPGYDDGYGGYSDDGSGYTDDGSQDTYVAPQQDTQQQYVPQQQEQQQSQAPLQSSTS